MTARPRTIRRSRAATRGAATASLIALAFVASSCAGTPERAPAAVGQPRAAATTETAVSDYPQYVALGDSYTAAPLVPVTDTTNGCLRSDSNYPSLVAAAMPGTTLVDVSCSGADSAAMVGAQQIGGQSQPAQFDALTEEIDLVTVGIGGNDFNLFGRLLGQCVVRGGATADADSCEADLGPQGRAQVERDLTTISSYLTSIVTGIRDRAPGATVVVVGYPQIVPATGTCPELLPLAPADYAYARELNEKLAAAVKSGALAAKAEYVDVFRASEGHDICSGDPWINGRDSKFGQALAFHPFAAEQAAVAKLVLAKL